ncbi:SBBP repeat-containing protein [Emticicia sp. SJ17W-69]|uniref:SBBP repeat-containing protein n=1 Tax=Emticicia sp. SJ17W-69 TaxID=3421657 RepID=UPI003EB9276A
MKKYLFSFCLTYVIFGYSSAQNVTILPSGISPTINGTYPRLSYDALIELPIPQVGDIAYDTTFLCLRVYNGSKWVCTYQNPSNSTPNMAAIVIEGGTSLEAAKCIAVDASGYIYITGSFSGTAKFGATTKTSAGEIDIFVAKYNKAGSLEWVQTAGGTDYEEVKGITIDANGNIYITGYFGGTTTFDVNTKTTSGGYDIFVAKYNNIGDLQWLQTAGGGDIDYGYDIAADVNGNVYVTGYFTGTAKFGTTTKTSPGGGDTDIFVVKYSTTGSYQWVQTVGDGADDFGLGIATDASGYVYVTGFFNGTATFGNTSKLSAGQEDIFVVKYNDAGSVQWVQTAGGTNIDRGVRITVDGNGNVYIIGNFSGTANFGATSKTSVGSRDIFVAKYNNVGTLQWVNTAGGTNSISGNGIALDASGNVYLTGNFNGTATFGVTSKTSAGDYDIFVAKYSNAGSLQWVNTANGGSGSGISTDASGNIYITGGFGGTVNFGATSKTSAGSSDIFVVRLQD